MSLVSICIPCHNAASYVGVALDSALAQTWPEIEIIVVDDASTDGSSEVLQEYAGRGVRVIAEKCGSASKARNRAFKEAKGDYIKFFDADDLLSPDHVRLQMERLKGRKDAIASSEWGRFRHDDLSDFTSNPQSVWKDMEGTDWLVEAWHDAQSMTQPGMFLIPRAILERAGAWDEELSLIDDFEFFGRMFCHASEVLFTPGAVMHYRSGLATSLSGQTSRKAVESALKALERGTSHLLARRQDESAKRSCANLFQDFIHIYYPNHKDLCRAAKLKVRELGGSKLPPNGPPRFHMLRKWIGWKAARRVQNLLGS